MGYRKGDVVTYTNKLKSKVEKIRTALDDGHLIYARVLSGIYGHEENKFKGEHSITIIGYDSNKFVFLDPDSNQSHEFGGGFGFLYYDSTDNRFTTAENDADLKVDSKGDHTGSQHRYQVLWFKTFN